MDDLLLSLVTTFRAAAKGKVEEILRIFFVVECGSAASRGMVYLVFLYGRMTVTCRGGPIPESDFLAF